MPLILPLASTFDDLLRSLKEIELRVPHRTEGRNKDHTEAWICAHLLSTFGAAGRWNYPLSVCHRDRPDFIIESGSQDIGLETTEAIPKEYADYEARAERKNDGTFLSWPAEFFEQKPSKKEISTRLKDDELIDDGWADDAPERVWAKFIGETWTKKLAKLASPDFQKAKENWLAIYDNLPLPLVDIMRGIAFLRNSLESAWSVSPSFDALIIIRDRNLFEITRHSFQTFPLEKI